MAEDRTPLRARKFARTRLQLLQALVAELETRSFEEVAVRDLCTRAEVSEATFFNYFPRKSDLLAYLGRVWGLALNWHARQAAAARPGLEAIAAVFEEGARQARTWPGPLGELLAHLASRRARPEIPPLLPIEKRLAWPELDGIEAVPDQGVEVVLSQQLQRAVELGQLPRNTHIPTVMVSLVSLFHGVALALVHSNPAAIAGQYRQQLALLWAGVRGLTGARTPVAS
ncbi:MAG: TetR/AcrR family transcriptional regulator [Gammaproteobacteria bacterium]|nr:MAG: TetR/AcrR family transcriptional regulator [Gammaproteobacteria bacterium]